MPLHDWSRVPAGLYHHFHQTWTVDLARALNRGTLPEGFCALLESRPWRNAAKLADDEYYASRANRIAVKRGLTQTVAVIEILSPGNKSSSVAFRQFVNTTVERIRDGVNLLIVDPFARSEDGIGDIHHSIWKELSDDAEAPALFPPEKNRLIASYASGDHVSAYLEPIGIGSPLPEMPLFLSPQHYVVAPLEASYRTSWDSCVEILGDRVV